MDHKGMRRPFAIIAVAELIIAILVLHSDIQNFFWVHSWWRSSLASMPAIAVAIFAFFQWRDSGKIYELQAENNRLQGKANELRKEANAERARANEALASIAQNTRKTPTKAERNAERLGKYLRRRVQVINADDSRWPEAAEIVEIKDEVVTLFTPSGFNSPTAFERYVHCGDLEIIETQVGSLPATLKVLKPYGAPRNLGEIKRWEERVFIPSFPPFSKGPNVFSAQYIETGSPEIRRLNVFESADGSNLYMLEASSAGSMFGDNQEISWKFMLIQFEYQTMGFAITAEGLVGASMNCSSTLENDPSPFYFSLLAGCPTLDHPQMNGCPGLKNRDQGTPNPEEELRCA
jgi:hypothetical protein